MTMRQQINLYQRARRVQVQLSAHSVLLVTAILSGALLALWAYGQFAVVRLQQQVTLLQQRQQSQADLAAAASVLYSEKIDAATLQQQVMQLTRQVQDHRQVLQLLSARAPLAQSGFANRLAALAQPHIEGVWLDGIVLNNQPGIQSLKGRSLNPALVAGYLRALGNEPALAGTRFNDVRILGSKYVDEHSEVDTDKPATSQATTGVRFQASNSDGSTGAGNATALAVNVAAGSTT